MSPEEFDKRRKQYVKEFKERNFDELKSRARKIEAHLKSSDDSSLHINDLVGLQDLKHDYNLAERDYILKRFFTEKD